MFLSNFSLFPSPLTKQAPPQEGPFALKSLIILPIPYEYKILQNIKEQNYLVFFFFFFHQFFFISFISKSQFEHNNAMITCMKSF